MRRYLFAQSHERSMLSTEVHRAVFPLTSCIHTYSERKERSRILSLAHIFRLLHLASHRPEVAVQSTAEELEQHLEANAGESWVVAAPVILSVCGSIHAMCPKNEDGAYFDNSSRMNACWAQAGS
jgi:hypothetical protein